MREQNTQAHIKTAHYLVFLKELVSIHRILIMGTYFTATITKLQIRLHFRVMITMFGDLIFKI